jgi:4-amino-4-deoxy-L-arabinose transferase-like glycosyltransferase
LNGEPVIPRRFHVCLGAYLAAQLAYRCQFPAAVNLDEAQQLLLAQRFEWGYNAQPPLYTWLQIGFFGLFGVNVLALGALKSLLLFGFFSSSFSLARRLLRDDRWAVAAVAALLLSPEVCWGTLSNLTHTVLLFLALALTWRAELRLAERPSAARYAAFGLCIALGVYSKYTYAAVLVAMAAAMAVVPLHRRVLLDRRMLLSLGVAIAALLPHALWLGDLAHSGTAGEITRKISVEGGGAALWTLLDVWSDVGYAIVWPLLGMAIAFRRRLLFPARGLEEPAAAWLRLFRVYAAAVLLLLTLFGLLAGGTHVRSRWIYPFLLYFPLAVLVRLRPAEDSAAGRKALVWLSCAVGVAAFAMFALRPFVGPSLGDRSRLNAPFRGIAREAEGMGFREGAILAPHDYLAGGLLLNLPGSEAYAPGLGFAGVPDLRGRRILLLWPAEGEGGPPAELVDLLRAAGVEWPSGPPRRIDLPYARSVRSRMTLDAIVFDAPR